MSIMWSVYVQRTTMACMALCMRLDSGAIPTGEETIVRLITEDALAIVTIMQEAAGEPYAGKLAVAEVIRNRMQQKYSSDGTVSGTVLRPKQFSGWNTSDPGRIRTVRADDEHHIVQDCIKAWEEAKRGSQTVGGAVLYYNPDPRLVPVRPDWAKPIHATMVAEIAHHIFFVPIPKQVLK